MHKNGNIQIQIDYVSGNGGIVTVKNSLQEIEREIKRVHETARAEQKKTETAIKDSLKSINIPKPSAGPVIGNTSGTGRSASTRSASTVSSEVAAINNETRRRAAETDRVLREAQRRSSEYHASVGKQKERDAKRVADNAVEQFRRVEAVSAESAQKSSSTWKAAFTGGLLGGFVGATIAQLSQIPSAVKQTLDEAVAIAAERQNAFKGLESIALFKGVDTGEAQKAVQSLRLVKSGVVDVGDAVTGLKNLLATGFSLPQAITIMERFSDASAFGKQAALSYGDAIRSATEGIKNQNSVLVDNAGVTKNISVILKERGFELQDLSDKTKSAAALQALYNGLLAETEAQVGDADKLTQTYTGSVASLDTAQKNLLATIGDHIITSPAMLQANKELTDQLDGYTRSVKNADSETGKFTRNAVSLYAAFKASVLSYLGSIVSGVHLFTASVAAGLGIMLTTVIGNIQFAIGAFAVGLEHIRHKAFGVLNSISDFFGGSQVANPEPSKIGDWMGLTKSFAKDTAEAFSVMNKEYEAMRRRFAEGNAIWGRVRGAGNNWQLSSEDDDYQMFREGRLPGGRSLSGSPVGTGIGSGTDKKGKGRRPPIETDREFRNFFEEQDFRVVRTFGKAINKGSPHPNGGAADVSIQGKTIAEIFNLMVKALEKGYRVFDERQKAPGVRQTGPHVHFENARTSLTKESRFLELGFSSEQLAYLRHLDKQRLGKTSAEPGLERFRADQSDALTEAARRENLEKAIAFYRMFGLIPDRKLIAEFQKLMADEARKLGQVQPSTSDVLQSFATRAVEVATSTGIISDSGTAGLSSTITARPRFLTDSEAFIQNLRISLGLEKKNEDSQTRQYQMLLRRDKMEQEIQTRLEDQRITREEMLHDLEIEMDLLRRGNVFEDARLKATQDRVEISREIRELQIEIANAGKNDSLIVEASRLRDILDLRNRERDAVISINRAQLQLNESTNFSGTQVKARVYEHLAAQKSLNDAIADGITKTYDSIGSKLDEIIDKQFEWAGSFKSLFTEPLKFIQRQTLTRITRGLVDKFLPDGPLKEGLTSTGNPVLDENQKQTNLLIQIRDSLRFGRGTGVTGNLFTNPGSVSGILGPWGGDDNRSALVSGMAAVGLGGQSSVGAMHDAAHDGEQQGGLGGIFGNFKGMFGPQKNVLTGKDSKAAGVMGGIGSIAAMVGGFVPGRAGKMLQYGGMGAQYGAMFGPWGAAIGAGVGALFGLFGGRDNAIKKLKEAALTAYSINVGDKSVLEAIKTIGEGYFGRGKVGANAMAVVGLAEAQEILRNYAATSGQSSSKLNRDLLADEFWDGNRFVSKFDGFREHGGPVMAGRAYIVGERRPELFVPHTNGTIMPSVPNMTTTSGIDSQLIASLAESIFELKEQVAQLGVVDAGVVVKNGARSAAGEIATATANRYNDSWSARENTARVLQYD